VFGIGEPVKAKAEGMGKNIFRRDAAIGEQGVVVEIPGQPAAVFTGVSRCRQAQGEDKQYQAGYRAPGGFFTTILHGRLFRIRGCFHPEEMGVASSFESEI